MQEIPYGTDVVQEPDKLAAAAIADDIHDATAEQLHDQLVSVMIQNQHLGMQWQQINDSWKHTGIRI